MDARLDSPAHSPAPALGSWMRLGRAAGLVTAGIGIGVLATMPLSGGVSIPTVVAVLAAGAAGAVAYLRPGRATALATVDVLLGLVVLATVFGRLGVLYIPSLLVFLAVTSRAEPPERTAEARAVEIPVAGSPLDEIERDVQLEPPSPTPARSLRSPRAAPVEADDSKPPLVEPAPVRRPGRHRAPSTPRRVAASAARAARSIGGLAGAGAERVRIALVDEPLPPAPRPETGRSWDTEFRPPPQRAPAAERSIGNELRDELEARELEMVATARSWSSLSHRAYGELRRLPLRLEPPAPNPPGATEIDDEQWDGPTWRMLGEQ